MTFVPLQFWAVQQAGALLVDAPPGGTFDLNTTPQSENASLTGFDDHVLGAPSVFV